MTAGPRLGSGRSCAVRIRVDTSEMAALLAEIVAAGPWLRNVAPRLWERVDGLPCVGVGGWLGAVVPLARDPGDREAAPLTAVPSPALMDLAAAMAARDTGRVARALDGIDALGPRPAGRAAARSEVSPAAPVPFKVSPAAPAGGAPRGVSSHLPRPSGSRPAGRGDCGGPVARRSRGARP